jgi:hypothetical protein
MSLGLAALEKKMHNDEELILSSLCDSVIRSIETKEHDNEELNSSSL